MIVSLQGLKGYASFVSLVLFIRNNFCKYFKGNASTSPEIPFTYSEDWSVSLSSFVNLDPRSQSKSISLHVPGNCYLVTVSAAVAIGWAVDWGRRTESPFWWWVLLHQLRRRRRRTRRRGGSRHWLRWRQQDWGTVRICRQLSDSCITVNRTCESSSPVLQLIRVDAHEKHHLIPIARELFPDKWDSACPRRNIPWLT